MTKLQKLKRLIQRENLNQTDFAERAGINSGKISEMVKGKYLTVTNLGPIARRYGTTLDWFFDDAKGWPPDQPGKGRELTPAQEILLVEAEELCAGDADPAKLMTALRRLMQTPRVHEDRIPPTALPPTEEEVKPRPVSARKDEDGRRKSKLG